MDKLNLRQFLHLRQTNAKNRAKLPSKASPFESEIHPSHKSGDLYSGYSALPRGKSAESTDVWRISAFRFCRHRRGAGSSAWTKDGGDA